MRIFGYRSKPDLHAMKCSDCGSRSFALALDIKKSRLFALCQGCEHRSDLGELLDDVIAILAKRNTGKGGRIQP